MESLQNTHSHKLQWLLIAVIAWPSAILQANDGANPYRVISERNAFSLGSGSRLAKPTRQPETKLKRDVKLTGIFQHEGVERAAIAVREPGSESARPTFMQLAKGEQKGNIRIEKIDRRTGSVTLTINGVKRQLNFKDNAYASTVTKTSRTPSTARRSTSSKAPSREGKEKKEKKSDTEKLAKINESLARGKITQAAAELKAAVLKGEISGERANLASMLENGLINRRAYETLNRLDDKALKSSLSELKQARKLDKKKAPKQKKKK